MLIELLECVHSQVKKMLKRQEKNPQALDILQQIF